MHSGATAQTCPEATLFRTWQPNMAAKSSRAPARARPEAGSGTEMQPRRSGRLDRSDLAALAAFHDGDTDALALGEIAHAGPLEHRAVDEEILGFTLDRDETEALHGIVPLHGSGRVRRTRRSALERLARRKPAPLAAIAEPAGATRSARRTAGAETTTAAASCGRIGRARVDADNLGHLRPTLAGSDTHHEGRAGFQRGIARRLDRTDVEES